jgi:hypothetical protein
MTRLCALALLVTCATVSPLARSASPAVGGADFVRTGMSQRELKQILGQPTHVSRLLLFRRHLEQWSYVDPPRWVEFSAPRGEEPTVNRFSGDKK